MKFMENLSNYLVGLFTHIRLGVLKFQSLVAVHGFWGATKQIGKNLFSIELMYRFYKDLTLPDALAFRSKILVDVLIFDFSFR